jgi:hypothetical protein
MRKAKIDRHFAALFFGQPIGVDARQRMDQRRFAVINMPGSANNIHKG